MRSYTAPVITSARMRTTETAPISTISKPTTRARWSLGYAFPSSPASTFRGSACAPRSTSSSKGTGRRCTRRRSESWSGCWREALFRDRLRHGRRLDRLENRYARRAIDGLLHQRLRHGSGDLRRPAPGRKSPRLTRAANWPLGAGRRPQKDYCGRPANSSLLASSDWGVGVVATRKLHHASTLRFVDRFVAADASISGGRPHLCRRIAVRRGRRVLPLSGAAW